LAGCQRCGDTPGTGTISGQVLDAVNYVYPVPNARVTLYNRGVPVTGGQTVTDNDGRFTFSTLDSNNTCVSYRIVVDFYQDNPCTGPMVGRPAGMSCNGHDWNETLGDSDESVNGGYWPYESATFGVSTFQSRGLNSDTNKIYLVPRVGADETVAVTTFRGNATSFLTYLELPVDQAYVANTSTPALDDSRLCELNAKDGMEPRFAGGTGPNGMCRRIIYWGQQGLHDLSAVPHSEIVCRAAGAGRSVSSACYTARMAPYVARFKRNASNRSGYYSYWLVDDNSRDAPPSWQYFFNASATVTIVTHDRIYKITPPTTPPTCVPPITTPIAASQRSALSLGPPWSGWETGNAADEPTYGIGKYWLAFQQNAVTGDVLLTNQLLCRGSSIPNEASGFSPASPDDGTGLPAYPLPWPLFWSDGNYAIPRF
jgi:hypothetical protein